MQKKDRIQIVVIGAGLTGLSLAFYLKKYGYKVTILEKSNRCGGVIQTHQENNFIYESGPNTGVLGNPEIVELFEDLDSNYLIEIADKEAEKRLIWKKGKWHSLPSGIIEGIKTPLFRIYDKFRILGEPFRRKGTNPYESIADTVNRRMGKSFLNYAVDPFIGGIYAGDPSKLITKYALPKLYNLEQNYGSFIKGGIAKKKETRNERTKKATKEVFSVKNGLSELIDRLEQYIGKENIIFNVSNINTVQNKNGYTIKYTNKDKEEQLICKNLITTCPAHCIKDVLSFADKKELATLSNVEYAPVSQLILGYNNWDGISVKAFGGLVPYIENRNILGVLFTSSFFKNKAPKNSVLLSIFIGGKRRTNMINLSEDELINIGIKEIEDMLKPKQASLQLKKLYKHKYAIPQYEISSKERFAMVKNMEKKYKGLYIGGNLKDGIGMSDRVKQARSIAEKIFSEEEKS